MSAAEDAVTRGYAVKASQQDYARRAQRLTSLHRAAGLLQGHPDADYAGRVIDDQLDALERLVEHLDAAGRAPRCTSTFTTHRPGDHRPSPNPDTITVACQLAAGHDGSSRISHGCVTSMSALSW